MSSMDVGNKAPTLHDFEHTAGANMYGESTLKNPTGSMSLQLDGKGGLTTTGLLSSSADHQAVRQAFVDALCQKYNPKVVDILLTGSDLVNSSKPLSCVEIRDTIDRLDKLFPQKIPMGGASFASDGLWFAANAEIPVGPNRMNDPQYRALLGTFVDQIVKAESFEKAMGGDPRELLSLVSTVCREIRDPGERSRIHAFATDALTMKGLPPLTTHMLTEMARLTEPPRVVSTAVNAAAAAAAAPDASAADWAIGRMRTDANADTYVPPPPPLPPDGNAAAAAAATATADPNLVAKK